MKLSLVTLRLLAIGVLGTSIFLLLTPPRAVTIHNQHLSVTFLDVGQGDAILIETPDGVQVLIDGGPDRRVMSVLAAELPWFDRTLDLVIGTHPDQDHIGGLVDVIANYEVGTLLVTENRGETMTATAYREAINDEAASVVLARAGQVFALGASTTLRVFSPASDPSFLESNTSSIVVQVVYGNTTFLLTGDAPVGIENYLAATYGAILQSDVLKLGHHGSDTSSGELFLDTVQPTYAVVSAGRDNRYGHPNQEVIDRVVSHHATIYATAEKGSVTFVSDGYTVWVE